VSGTGGVSPYTWMWSDGSINSCVNDLPNGVYTVSIVDAMGCMVDTSFVVLNAFTVTTSSTPSFCRNGTATVSVVGGSPPYAFSWNTTPVQTDSMAINLVGGETYNITISDSFCTMTESITITSLSNMQLALVTTPDSCNTGKGSVTVQATGGIGPYSYLWNTTDTTTSLDSLLQGLYQVTVVDDSGCILHQSINISNYTPITVASNITQPNCTQPDGSATLIVSGGIPPYAYFWNTVPVQTDSTAINLSTGLYTVIVTDQQGCSNQVNVIITDNSLFTVSSTIFPDTCFGSRGSMHVNTSNGIPPLTFDWIHAPGVNDSIFNNLYKGHYKCFVTDSAGCVRKTESFVYNYSPLQLSVTETDASCIFTADGSAVATATNGTPPYHYQWTNGDTSNSTTGLLPGYHNVSVVDSIGCQDYEVFNVGYSSIATCAVDINGTVFNDLNADCIKNSPEISLPMVKILCTPIGGYKFTTISGAYQFILPTGIYNTYQYIPVWFRQECPAFNFTDTLLTTGMTVTNDFADTGSVVDLYVNCNSVNVAEPGEIFIQSVFYGNNGTVSVSNGVIKVIHDSLVTFLSSIPVPTNYNSITREIIYNVNVNGMGQSGSTGQIEINYQVPATLLAGSHLSFIDSIFPLSGDTLSLNNVDWCINTVYAPFDPNNIEVTPTGVDVPGYISQSDSVLKYTVHFQNTGNYYARYVKIEVQLDEDLDFSSLEFTGCTFPFTARLSLSGELVVEMNNIYLPDSNSDELNSHGYVAFKIKQLPNLSPGTPIDASAAIYFNYNTPVLTNVVLNTITGVDDPIKQISSLKVFPNPTSNSFMTEYSLDKSSPVKISLTDLSGRKVYEYYYVKESTGQHTHPIDVSKFSQGVYILSIESGVETLRAKVCRQ
jgi:hypothetical protein